MQSTVSSQEQDFLQTHGDIDRYKMSFKIFLRIKTPRRQGLMEELRFLGKFPSHICLAKFRFNLLYLWVKLKIR